jgi:hypothetical protein
MPAVVYLTVDTLHALIDRWPGNPGQPQLNNVRMLPTVRQYLRYGEKAEVSEQKFGKETSG